MHKTKSDLPKTTRTKMIELCNARLADAQDLYSQVKHAHWNVRGPQFIALHELFDEVAEKVEDLIDEVAERATALGGAVEGTVRSAARRSALPEYPAGLVDGKEHVDALSTAFAAFNKGARKAIDDAERAEDKATADLFTQTVRETDKLLWLIEAHLQGK